MDTNGSTMGSTYEGDARARLFMEQTARKKRAAAIIVPTDDGRVRTRLRDLGEPITLFGEGPSERRDRLREILLDQEERAAAAATADGDEAMPDASSVARTDEKNEEQDEEFYTEGTASLLSARRDIATYSLQRARKRLIFQRLEATIPLRVHSKYRAGLKDSLKTFELYGSQMTSRPVSITRFSPDSQLLAAGDWDGVIQIFDLPSLTARSHMRGHSDRVSGISWFPGATLPSHNVSPSSVNLASGGGDGHVQLWSLEHNKEPKHNDPTTHTPLATLRGHTERVVRTEFHPSGRYLASASFDTTWRLWDVATEKELLLQEGHSQAVYSVAWNNDGSLLASGGLDAIGRVWDVRTGRTILILEGHMRDVCGLDWGPDGFRLVSGSMDGLALCWDMRMVKETARIPAHSNGVADVRWYQGNDGPAGGFPMKRDEAGDLIPKRSGTYMVTCGFDRTVKIFSADDWVPVATLSGHSGNVLSTDMSNDSRFIASGAHDRTVKLWARDNTEPV